jgi:hypothetical protein
MRYLVNALFCAVGLGVLMLAVFLTSGSSGLETDAPRPTLTVWHQRMSAVHSRCDECPQPGDMLRMRLRGAPDTVHGIAVYLDERSFDFCFGCADFSTVIDRLGRYSVIGFQMRLGTACALPRTGMDADIAALAQCGVALAKKVVEVR